MGVNKVNFGNNTLIDLTGDTITASTLAMGVTAHSADGEAIVGSMIPGGGGGIILDPPTNVSIINNDEEALITWTDPDNRVIEDVTVAEWAGTLVIRKPGSAPTSYMDGTVVYDSTIKNAHTSVPLSDTGLTNGVTYYYGVFPHTTEGAYTLLSVTQFTPSAIYPTAVSDLSVESGNKQITATWSLPLDAASVNIVCSTPGEIDIIYTNVNSPFTATGLIGDTMYDVKAISVNLKGRETESESITVKTSSFDIVSFAQGTNEQLKTMLDKHYAGDIDIHDYWSVGDERTVSLSAISRDGYIDPTNTVAQTVTMILMNAGGKTLADGSTECAFVVGQKNGLGEYGYRMSTNSTGDYSGSNAGGWRDCRRRTWFNNQYYNAIESGFKAILKQFKNKTGMGSSSTYGTYETSDYVALPAEVEVTGANNYSVYGEGTQFEYYETSANRRKKNMDSIDSSSAWWTRSPYKNDSKSFVYCNISQVYYDNAYNGNIISPFMCI